MKASSGLALLTVMLAAVIGQAQTMEDGTPASSNIRGQKYPQIDSGLRCTFRLKAPDAQRVRLHLDKDYDMDRDSDGVWSVTTTPQVPGFHYYWFMLWTSGGYTGYTTGIAISDSGRLAGPWTQQAEPVYAMNGGHAMLFTTFEGRLMMVLHSPNGPGAQPRIFEMEDTGDTLRIMDEFNGNP